MAKQEQQRPNAIYWRFAVGVSLLIAALTLLPTLSSWETMWDNIMSHLHVRQGRTMHEVGMYHFAEVNGRIPAYFMSIADSLAWRFGKVGHQVIKTAFLLAHVLTFAWVIYRLGSDRWLALLAGGGFFVVLQNHTNFDIVGCFVVSMHLPAIALLVAIPALQKFFTARDNNTSRTAGALWITIAAILVLISLLYYEMFLLFVPLLPLLAWLTRDNTESPIPNSNPPNSQSQIPNPPNPNFFRACLPAWIVLGAVCVVYVAVYAFLASRVESEYKGSEIDGLNLQATVGVLTDYTLSGLPAAHLIRADRGINAVIVDDSRAVRGTVGVNSPTLLHTLGQTGPLARMILAGTLAWLCIARLSPIAGRRRLALWIFAVALILLPNILVALTAGHQRYHEELGYLAHNTTWFCALGWWLAIALCLSTVARVLQASGIARVSIAGIGAVAVAALALLTDAWNTNVHAHEKNFSSKFRNIESFLASDLFLDLPEDAVILAPSLYNPRSYWEKDLYKYHEFWSYFNDNTDLPEVRFVRTPTEFAQSFREQEGKSHYFLKYGEAEGLHRQFLALAPITVFDDFPGFAEVGAREIDVLHFSPTSEVAIQCRWLGKPGQVEIRGGDTIPRSGGSDGFAGVITDAFDEGQPYTRFSFRALADFDPQTLSLNYYLDPAGSSVAPAGQGQPVWSSTFWDESDLDDGTPARWCWSHEEGTIKVFLPGDLPRQGKVSLKLLTKAGLDANTEKDGPVTISFGDFESPLSHGDELTDHPWTLRPGINTILFQTTASSLQVTEDVWHNFAIAGFQLTLD